MGWVRAGVGRAAITERDAPEDQASAVFLDVKRDGLQSARIDFQQAQAVPIGETRTGVEIPAIGRNSDFLNDEMAGYQGAQPLYAPGLHPSNGRGVLLEAEKRIVDVGF